MHDDNDNTTTTTTAPPAALAPLIRHVPRVPMAVYADRPCGRLLYKATNDRDRERIKRAINFESMTPDKLEALQDLGAAFVEVDAPEEKPKRGKRRAARESSRIEPATVS